MASLSVYLTLNLTASSRNEFVYVSSTFFIGTYGVSAICLLLVSFVYAMNLRQMNTKKNKIAKPLKGSRALMVIQCSTYLMVNQALEIVIVIFRNRLGDTLIYWVQIISILCSLLFYMWCFALYVINFYIARNLKNASYMLIGVYVYLVAYLIPMLVVGVIVILSNAWYQGQHNHDLYENKIYWKALLLAIRLLIIYIMTAVNTYAFVRQIGSLRQRSVSLLTKLRALCQTRKLRNGVLLEVNILLVWLLNVMLAVQYHLESDVSKIILCLAVFFQSLLGPYFLVFEVISYSKELRKGFGRRPREYALSGARFRSVITKQVGAMMMKDVVEEEVEIDDMLLNNALMESLKETTL